QLSDARPLETSMKIAYVQVGAPEHGICRYGRTLAAEARRRPELEVREENVVLSGVAAADRGRLELLGESLAGMDLVHLQVSPWGDGSWGNGWRALANLRAFRSRCRAPLAVTLHDVNGLAAHASARPLHFTRALVAEALRGFRPSAIRFVKQILRGRFSR